MPEAAEYKSVVGVDNIKFALVTQDNEAGYVAGTPETFAPAINVNAEPRTSQETQYADNAPFDVMTGEGPTIITMDTTNIPVSVLATILGKTFDAASGRMFDTGSNATPPDVALSFRSMKSNGAFRYFQYLKGKFSVPKDEAATATDKKEPKPTQIIYTAVNTLYKFDVGGSENKTVKRVIGDDDSVNFDGSNWFAQVQTPITTSPSALALSSSVPVDEASGVSVGADLTLTFNNALQDAAINGVTLIKVSDGSVVAGVNTLNVTKKVMTINPTGSLTAATDYLLVYAVTDVFGQTLNGSVNFTTA